MRQLFDQDVLLEWDHSRLVRAELKGRIVEGRLDDRVRGFRPILIAQVLELELLDMSFLCRFIFR